MVSQTKLWNSIEWAATITLIFGVALTSWNIYPSNIYMSAVGNFLWLLMALHWKKWSLITIQVFILLLYTGGVVKVFFGS
jgi:hypothetical protein